MNKLIAHTVLLIGSMAILCSNVIAQNYSYLYIQGDKKVPFYVKVNGVMQPRYSKNYCIVPKLSAGEIKIEVLFQQNAYPSQTYSIQIPENSSKGYLLNKDGEDYALYDLNTKNYIHPVKQ